MKKDDSLKLNRRGFIGAVGSSAAMAGIATTGCIRKPKEKILPYTKRPEEVISGQALYFATAFHVGSAVSGLLVESHEGRPTKIEGNPEHPFSLGGTTVWGQSYILDLYDPDRSQNPRKNGEKTPFSTCVGALKQYASTLSQSKGAGAALLVENIPSPTFRRLLNQFQTAYPQSRIYVDDPTYSPGLQAASSVLNSGRTLPLYQFDKSEVIASFGSDFLGIEGDVVRNTKHFSSKRKVHSPQDAMNRLYVCEPFFTLTGSMADHRMMLRECEIGFALLELAKQLSNLGLSITGLSSAKSSPAVSEKVRPWVQTLAKDLLANKGKSLITVGARLPGWVHGIGAVLNNALGNIGQTLRYYSDTNYPSSLTLQDFASDASSGKIDTLFILGSNAVYHAPKDIKVADLITNIKDSVYLGYWHDETSAVCQWHVPSSHGLEAWGDLKATDGTTAIQQPLIAPLYESVSPIEFLGYLLGVEKPSGFSLVQETWKPLVSPDLFEKTWRQWIHDGVCGATAQQPLNPTIALSTLENLLAHAEMPPEASVTSLDLLFTLDNSVFDGRFSNNGWLQELPDPISKLTWDNAALMSSKTASLLGVQKGSLVSIEGDKLNGSLTIAVLPITGIADHTIVLPRGYGRKIGVIGKGVGFSVESIRTTATLFGVVGAQAKKVSGSYTLALNQEHDSLEERPIIREAKLSEFKEKPDFVNSYELLDTKKQKNFLWEQSNHKDGHQWGMAIDLNVCTGCHACTIACQSENNIPVVGKERVLNRKAMHWINPDRYFSGTVDNPMVSFQPMACIQCENAPCESVCPVAATVHNKEGISDIAYNRCIGTRFCKNNCPVNTRARVFNFHNYQKENDDINPMYAMQKNPSVTVRFRGVVEKCNYCIQRINHAKIEAKVRGDGVVHDGRIVTACQQACPADAIVFGDINTENSKVNKWKSEPRNYLILNELNLQPRTSYLAKLRNPNPELV